LDNLDQIRVFDKAQFDDLIALDDALARLELIDPRAMQVVECRFFAGLNVKETAEFLRVSQKTVKNDWQYAKAWLSAELKSQP
jgi:RNA polymerase sigma factor (sigma-70 family)